VKFRWGDSHDWPVFVVEEFVLEGDAASKEVSDAGEWTDRIELWAGEFGKRVKSKSVYCLQIR